VLVNRIHPFVCKIIFKKNHCVVFGNVVDETGRWFSPDPPVSSTNKTDRYDITAILLKVASNTIKQTNTLVNVFPVSSTTFPNTTQ
jgi:hypothetical protein